MDAYAEVRAALPGRPRWQLVGFAAGCAQRLLPMAARLGESSLAERAEAGMALAWNATAGRTAQPQLEHAISDLLQVLEATPEDRWGLNMLAVEALGLAVFALEVASTSTPTDRAQAAGAVAIDLVSQVDFALAYLPLQHPVIIETDGQQEEQPPGPLAAKEIQAQHASIALLDLQDRPDTQAIAALRQRSKVQAVDLSQVIPEFARRWAEHAQGN
jgi:hypothetical protein